MWDHFERGGDILPQLTKPGPAAAFTGAGRIQHDPLAGQVLWESGADLGPLAFKAFDRTGLGQRLLGGELCFAGVNGQLLEDVGHLIGDKCQWRLKSPHFWRSKIPHFGRSKNPQLSRPAARRGAFT